MLRLKKSSEFKSSIDDFIEFDDFGDFGDFDV